MSREDDTYFGNAYRFISFDALWKTVQTRSLRLTRVDKLNDPLDTSAYISVDKFFWSHALNDSHVKQIQELLFNRLLSKIYIACFSKIYKSRESYLMWAYYANGHTQLCFELNFQRFPILEGPLSVNYVDSLVRLRNRIEKNIQMKVQALLMSKSSIWKHEQEVRLLYKNNVEVDKAYKFSDDRYRLFIPFNPRTISKVIFGLSSNTIDEIKTIKLFLSIGHAPRFEKMIINPLTLKLESRKYIFKMTDLDGSDK
ncbi:MAG TPA: hypothetical protein VK541_07950 [Pedobacter sp.]|uniref:hypothetical protein n=1 Tax=Pedobacter sp. TaxID=1411316 RepID=UPI002CAF4D3F|nr:hypothetical protein [Pedobacter sp.]HMI02397.1 hypothetical protein [Pedobacter sp.]